MDGRAAPAETRAGRARPLHRAPPIPVARRSPGPGSIHEGRWHRGRGPFAEYATDISMTGSARVRVLYDEASIARRNEDLARAVADTKPQNLLVVAILKGSFMFAADLIRAL